MRPQLKPYLRILIAGVMLFLLYRNGLLQLNKIRDALYNPIILSSGLLLFAAQMIFAVRFRIVASMIETISFALALKLQLIGQFFNTFIPGGVGGDVVKAIELAKSIQKSKRNTLAVTLVDRLVGLYGLILFSFLFLLIELRSLSDVHIKYFKASIALFVVASLCLLFKTKIALVFSNLTKNIRNEFVLSLKDSMLIFFSYLDEILKLPKLLPFLLTSASAQFFSITFLFIAVSQGAGDVPPIGLFYPLVCFGFVAMAIPITPGGIGFGQAAFYFIFKSFGEATGEAAIVAISLMQLFNILFSLPGGYFFIKSPRHTG